MPFRPTAVRIHPEVDATYAAFERDAREGRQPAAAVWKALQTCLARIHMDGQWGEVIPPKKIPAYFRKRYEVTNLDCIDLASFHRGFYTIHLREVSLLDIVDHARYDELFPGSRRR